MKDRRIAWGTTALALVAAAAVLAPWLGLRDPLAQPDTLVLRDLPPLSRVHAIVLDGGERIYADEIEPPRDGKLRYRRGPRWHEVGTDRLRDAAAGGWRERPSFLLGTDSFGRDLLARLVHGARASLLVGLLAAAMAVGLGTLVGAVAGLGGGWVDATLMRVTDMALAIPRLFLALLLVALFGPSVETTILVLGGTTWMAAARLVRGEMLSLREREFVQAARAAGVRPLRLGAMHLLPSAILPVVVEATLRVGDTILLESALSFLGLGVRPPLPSWGNLIAEGRINLLDRWWVATFPGLAIAATVIALNVVGDGLRERLSRRSA